MICALIEILHLNSSPSGVPAGAWELAVRNRNTKTDITITVDLYKYVQKFPYSRTDDMFYALLDS